MDFLPITRDDMEKRGWDQPDFVFVSGDAYVDHPSFGPAIISRVLESRGYRVAIIAQPDWRDDASICTFGRPKLGFLVSSGNMDSMVNHYTVAKKRRSFDAYTPGGVIGRRPDRATTVYCNLIRKSYRGVPIIIGGIEASLRRMAHYDYWSDSLRRSILLDSQADILVYGMGEYAIVEIADALNSGIPVQEITYIDGTAYRTRRLENVYDYELLPSFEELKADRRTYARSFYMQYQNTDPFTARRLVEPYGEREFVVQNPPAKPLTTAQMDEIYDLPYLRTYHPSYEAAGGVPAIQEVRFSLTSCRGCFGACNFCALTFHQGRIVQTRSHASILREAELMTHDPNFKGYIHDVGGPTANFRHPACRKQLEKGACRDRQCLFPTPCKNLNTDHSDYLTLLRRLRKLPGVKKVFVRSGIRFDYVLAGQNDLFIRELCEYHVSGQLKLAPEHVSDVVLRTMGKPQNEVYRRFIEKYEQVNQRLGKKQFVEPYLMSSHPGSGWKEAIELAEYLQATHGSPEQVQDFYPTPSTISTCMYYTGLDPRTMKPVPVTRNPHEKAMQRALLQYRDPKNYALVVEALRRAGREDLIGYGPHCLVRPRGKKSERRSPAQTHSAQQERKRLPANAKYKEKNSGKATTERRVRPAYEKSLKRPKR